MLLHVSIVSLIICLCNCSTCVVLTIIYGFCKLLILPISKGMVLEMYKINPYMSRSSIPQSILIVYTSLQSIQVHCLLAAHWVVLEVPQKEGTSCATKLCCDSYKEKVSIPAVYKIQIPTS